MQIKFNRKLRSALALTVCAAMLLSCSQKKDETSSADTTSTQSPITEDTGEILTLPDYDFYSLDLSKYVKLPEDHLTRDYGEGLRLLGIPSDKTVMANLKKDVLEKLAKEKEVDENATVIDFDFVVIDYVGKLDGVEFEGGSATNASHEICIDASSFIDGFDAGLLGMKVGETKDLNLTFPTPYNNNPELAGKAVVFTVTLDKITRYEYPELTDELVTENPSVFGEEYDSAAAFLEYYTKSLTETYVEYDLEQKTAAAWDYLYENMQILEYPSEILSAYEQVILKSYQQQAKSAQQTFEVYVVSQGYLSVDDFNEKVVTKTAKDILSEKLLIYSLASEFKLTVTNEEATKSAREEYTAYIEPYISYYAMYYGISDFDSFMTYMGGIGTYRDNILYSEALKLLCGEKQQVDGDGLPESDSETTTEAG